MADKLDLMETGTRFQHYTELLDVWADGIDILKNTIKKFDGTADKETLVKLTNARDMLQRRIDVLADTDAGVRLYSNLAKQIDAIPIHRTFQLTEGQGAQEGDKTDQQTGHSQEGSEGYSVC